MPQYAAFLRGINPAKHRRISGEDLCAAFEGMGFEDVGTFRASGNVVFGGASGSEAKLKARVEAGLLEATGMEIVVFLRSANELKAIAEYKPFDGPQVEKAEAKLQVSILSRKPTAAVRTKVLALATADDRLAFGERELYWLPSGGILDTELDLKAIEKLLG